MAAVLIELAPLVAVLSVAAESGYPMWAGVAAVTLLLSQRSISICLMHIDPLCSWQVIPMATQRTNRHRSRTASAPGNRSEQSAASL